MSRYRAFAIHFAISALVVGTFMGLVLLLWYPPDLLAFAFPMRLFLTLIAVDVVAGPVLTLIVYRHGKPGLRFDLICIALVQLGFLIYGVHSAWTTRPVWLVAAAGQIDVVFANEVLPKELAKSKLPDFLELPTDGPRLAGARLPEDPKEREALLMEALAGQDISRRPEYFGPYAEEAARLFERKGRRLGDGLEPLEVDIVSNRGAGFVRLDAATGQPIDSRPDPQLQ